MAHLADYHCNDCANIFRAEHGDLDLVRRLRCVNCDNVFDVPIDEYPLPLPTLRRRKTSPDRPTLNLLEQAELDRYNSIIQHNKRCRTDWSCPQCRAELRDDLLPMCPICRSRNVRAGRIYAYLD